MQLRMGRDFGDLVAFLNEDPKVPGSLGGGTGRLAGSCAAGLSAAPDSQGQWLRVRSEVSTREGLSQADRKRVNLASFTCRKEDQSGQEHSNFTRCPPTRRNSGLCKITVAEGSEE